MPELTCNFGMGNYELCSAETSTILEGKTFELIDERAVVVEMITGFRRAGADMILTYWARELAQWLPGY